MSRRVPTRKKEELEQQIALAVSRILSRDISHEEVLRAILKEMCEQLSWLAASFWTLGKSKKTLHCKMIYCREECPEFERVTQATRLRRGEGLPGRVWKKGTPVWIPDVVEDENFPRVGQARKDGLHAAVGFPISVRGKFIGVIEFFSREISKPDTELLNAFALVGTELGQFFERWRVENELAEQVKLNKYAAEIGIALNGVHSLSSIMQTCSDITVRELGVALADIWVYSETSHTFKLMARAADSKHLESRISAESYRSDLMAIGAAKESFATNDILNDERLHVEEWARCEGLFSFAAYPLMMNGTVLGELCVFAKRPLAPDMLDVLSRVSISLASCIARKNSEERFRQFANVVDEVFFLGSARLTEFYYVSPAYQQVWGAPPADVLADPLAWAKAIVPEHKERVSEYVKRLRGDSMPAESEIEYAIKRPDGKKAWMSARCFRIDQQDGSWQICGTVRDVTDRKEAEQRVSDFYSMVSHELRTPLTSIKGSLLLLERRQAGDLTGRAQDLIALARKECDRLIRLINDFLDIKTIEAGKLQLYREELNVAQMVDETVQAMSALAADRKVKLKQRVQTREAIFADRDRVVQILTNLLSNAIKFAPEDSEVLVCVEKADRAMRFSVTDNGPGIAKDEQARLFKAFQQAVSKDGLARQGTGLGLAICKGIVDEHGGEIGMLNNEGKGATFWVQLPIGEPD